MNEIDDVAHKLNLARVKKNDKNIDKAVSGTIDLILDLAVGFFIGCFVGFSIDKYLNTLPMFLFICSLFGAIGGWYSCYKKYIRSKNA